MSGVYADPYAVYAQDEDDRPTWPPPGSVSLVVEDKCFPMFTSVEWSIVMQAKGKTIAQSSYKKTQHSIATLRRWARTAIRMNVKKLRSIGVDVEAEYVKLGGIERDLTGL